MTGIITRFAPSPTGYLHIGSARTALFNYLFAKANNGKFLLRIEDTDRQRSTNNAVETILSGLKWLDLLWDDNEIYQFSRAKRHQEVALELLRMGKAYKCFLTQEELELMRMNSMKTGLPIVSPWREIETAKHPNLPYVIRIKSPLEGVTVIEDLVQGLVTTTNNTLDDMVLLRSDGTPTYMLAVVVDDHDMGITHIIRGDDHLGNAARQLTIYNAMKWNIPKFVHIPLIHGPDGKKLSKRHGALGVEGYKDMGYLPEALCNYLLRLGWSHGDDEIITREQAIKWFNLDAIGKSPARLDFKKLNYVNNHYLRLTDNKRIFSLLNLDISNKSQENIMKGLDSLKQRANTLIDITQAAKIYIEEENIVISDELLSQVDRQLVKEYQERIFSSNNWSKEYLMEVAKAFAQEKGIKLGDLATHLRILLTGSTISPSVFEIISIISREVINKRLSYVFNA